MKNRVLALFLSAILIGSGSLAGCGKHQPKLNVRKQVNNISKHIDNLDVDYLVKHVYVDPIDADNEVAIAATFMADVLIRSGGTVVETVGDIILNGLEKVELLSRKELKQNMKELKKNLKEDLEYEITDYQVIEDAHTVHPGAVVVSVTQQVTVKGIPIRCSSYIEFVPDGSEWKFHLIDENEIYDGPIISDMSADAEEKGDSSGTKETSEAGQSIGSPGTAATADYRVATDENVAAEFLAAAGTAVEIDGIDLAYDLSEILFLFAPDNTKSMKGYSTDPQYQTMMKGLENVFSRYMTSKTVTIQPDDNGFIHWEPYNGNVGTGVKETSEYSDYPYFCNRGKYEDEFKGPLGLLLDDEMGVGSFGNATVTAMVTDLHEQGATLHKLGSQIRKECVENLGDESEYAVAIFSFDFYFDGTSWMVNPNEPGKNISADLNGSFDKKPLYVILAGQKNGVYHSATALKEWLQDNSIPYDCVDNLKVVEDPGVQIEWQTGNETTKAEIKALNKSKSDTKKEDLQKFVDEHVVRLRRCTPEEAETCTAAGFSEDAVLYVGDKLGINASYKGCFNWCATYVTETASDYSEVPYKTVCDSVQVFQEVDGSWKELSELEWSKLFTLNTEDGRLQVFCIPKNDMKFKDENFRFIFHMKQSIEKTTSYPSWIRDKDLVQSGVINDPVEKEWHKKTQDLNLFARSMLALDSDQTAIDNGISHTADIELVLLKVKNK